MSSNDAVSHEQEGIREQYAALRLSDGEVGEIASCRRIFGENNYVERLHQRRLRAYGEYVRVKEQRGEGATVGALAFP